LVSAKKKIARTGKISRLRRRKVKPQPAPQHLLTPHLCLLRAPSVVSATGSMPQEIRVATYNVHRWTGRAQ